MRDFPVLRAALLCCALFGLAACEERDADRLGAQRGPQLTRVQVYAATQAADFLPDLAGAYTSRQPDVKIETRYAGSRVLASQLEVGSPADLFISNNAQATSALTQKTISARPWVNDLLVVVIRNDDDLTMYDFEHTDHPVAIGDEIGSLGLYTRLALRKRDIWMDVQPRTRQYTSAHDIIDQVNAGNARFGVVHATLAAANARTLKVLEYLELPDTVEVTYTLVALTPAGDALARWLLSPEAVAIADSLGLTPARTASDPAPR